MNSNVASAFFFVVVLATLAVACGPGSSSPMPDSGFRVAFGQHGVPGEMAVGEKLSPAVTIKNTSDITWPSKPDYKELNAVHLSYHWLDRKGKVVVFDGLRTALPSDVRPGESVKLNATIQAPDRPGSYTLEITLVQEGVDWFPDRDGDKLTISVNVVQARK